MPLRGKVVITCAVTGSIHTPTMSPHLPLTPDEIARDAIAAAEAGAAILHLHARDPKDGRPTPDPDVFMQFLPRIKQSTGAVVNITTGGGHGMSLEERLAAPLRAKPEMCSLNMGSMNFGLFPLLEKYKEFKYPWESRHLEMTRDFIFRNTFADIERILKDLGEGCGTRFEFECYDVGHLYNLAHFLDRGLVKPPLFVQTIFGILGGIGADAAQDAVDQLQEHRRLEQPAVDAMREIVEMAGIVTLVLEFHAVPFTEQFVDALDIAEGIAENIAVRREQIVLLPVMLERCVLAERREQPEIHRPHVERRELR